MAFFQATSQNASAAEPDTQGVQPVNKNQVSEENLRERRYLWTARAFAMLFIVGLITNILMLSALSSLKPLVRVQPYQLTFSDKKTQVVNVAPMSVSPAVMQQMTRNLLSQYVKAYHSISSDKDEMMYKWGTGGLIDLMSAGPVYNQFQLETRDKLDNAFRVREVRVVDVKSILPYADDGWWKIDFDLIINSPERNGQDVLPYVALAKVRYEPTKVTWEKRWANPVGFKVENYGASPEKEFQAREKGKNK